MYRIEHSAFQFCELKHCDKPRLGTTQIAGPTQSSLLSPGTEINAAYCGDSFPRGSGYASVFEVQEIGDAADGFAIGDLVFCMGNHSAWTCCNTDVAVKVPTGLSPQLAVMARLLCVSQTTLVTCAARPGEKVFITGLGPVGFLAALQFQLGGYEVIASDPHPHAVELAQQAGITVLNEREQLDQLEASLAIDCSGHEAAVLQCARATRRCGEVVLIGVPWQQRCDASAHQLLDLVFHRYIYLRSGWEWEIPRQALHFNQHRSIFGNIAIAMQWLAEKRIIIPHNVSQTFHPQDCNDVYQGHLHLTHQHLCSIFDWTQLHASGVSACNA